MCPLRIIPKIFLFDEQELTPELRAQRTLNVSRVPEMARYVAENPHDYVFSALTASIDADVGFEPLGKGQEASKVGVLSVPMDARFIINDGQHRRAAIEAALERAPELGDETIAVVFFLDKGLERCQQMFADLNRHAVRPSKSLGVLYDHRDEGAGLVRLLVLRSAFFRDLVEMERSTLSPRSRKLFTLSALYRATQELLDGIEFDGSDAAAKQAAEYWEAVSEHFPQWQQVRAGKMSAGEVRKDFIHSHGIVLQALGTVGNELLRRYPETWGDRLKPLTSVDWARSNQRLWEGRAMIGGRVSKSSHNVTLTINAIKTALGLDLMPEEQKVEDAYNGGHNDG
ncbi:MULTISPECIES: DNA sulfur modification protein DndB [unclassified Thioalkalivibrio]|uniref:DNA sulfur modification protein DndB n=1 Tax=unclassified Thioalkalivibrio TaxID=2621013 RepID=UPI00037ADC99|nr:MULTISPECIES: DNA sulfur modification protein DndB [unclassified Thioalkalivibrio]